MKKKVLITIFVCLLSGMATSQQLTPASLNGNPKWLIIETNGYNFSPDHTRLISAHKPIFRQLPNGHWEIRFKSNE